MCSHGNILQAVSQMKIFPPNVFTVRNLTQKNLKNRRSNIGANGLHIRSLIKDAEPEEWSELCDLVYEEISDLDLQLRPVPHGMPDGFLSLDEIYSFDVALADRCLCSLVRTREHFARCHPDRLPFKEVSRMALSLPKNPENPHFRNLMKYVLEYRFNG